MMTGKIALAAVSLGVLVLTGCATPNAHAPIAASPGTEQALAQGDTKDVQCVRTYPTGSHLPKIICTTKEERESEQMGAQRELHNAAGKMGPKCNPHCT